MIRFQNPNHTRIFVIFMTTLGVGTYFSPTLYRMFYLPRKLARERQERDAAELEQVAAGMILGWPFFFPIFSFHWGRWWSGSGSQFPFVDQTQRLAEVGEKLEIVTSVLVSCLFCFCFFKPEFVAGSVLGLDNGLDCQSSGQGFDPWAQQAEGLFASTSESTVPRLSVPVWHKIYVLSTHKE